MISGNASNSWPGELDLDNLSSDRVSTTIGDKQEWDLESLTRYQWHIVAVFFNKTGNQIGVRVDGSNAFTPVNDSIHFNQSVRDCDDVTFNKVTSDLVGDVTVNVTVKVADDGSGSQNVFYFLTGSDTGSGVKSLNWDLQTNTKVKFDTSDSSLSGHNFKFSTVQDGSHNGGSEYTTNVTVSGTPGSANSYTEIEVTAEVIVANKLYYYCSHHGGMGGDGQITLSDNRLQNFTEVHQDTITSSSGVVTLDLSQGNSGSITLSENVTQFTIKNVPKDGVSTFTLIITQDSSDRTVGLTCAVNGAGGANAKTPGAAGYTMSTGSGAIDIITFIFKDAGTPFLLVQQAFA